MPERPQYVVDASVAGKWYLVDETHTDLATRLLLDYQEGRVDLIAPYYIRYEVPSLICKAVGAGRLASGQARHLLAALHELKIPTYRPRWLTNAAFESAFRYTCTFYDGLYVSLAEATESPLIHADTKLRRSLNGRCSVELWIEDY